MILGGALKHICYKDLRKCILRCDILIQYLPNPDQLKRLQVRASNKPSGSFWI